MNRSTALAALLVSGSLSSVAAAATTTPVAAGDAPADAASEAPSDPAQARHKSESADIIVTGLRRKSEDVLGGVSVLSGADLTAAIRPSLGETLSHQPGVSASSFGPTASRPILRGLSGDRIRILTDGIGSLDVSSSSADHAVAINPLTADRIEVLRGPAALLFGSSAIGGVVNVIDARIPRREPESPFHATGLLSYGSAAHERSANLSLDIPLGGHFVLHGDGNRSRSDDLRVGGHLLSPALRRQAQASFDPAIRDLADLSGSLTNSAAKSTEVAGGVAYVDGKLNIGASVSRHTALYGVPLRYSLDPAVAADAPRLDVEQTRYDARAEVPLSGLFSEVRLRGGYARYHHDEIKPDGAIASSFFTNGGEARGELVQSDRSGWGGGSGVQYLSKRVSIAGDEKFLPTSRQRQSGLFTVQNYARGPLRIEAGARYEQTRLSAAADPVIGNPDLKRRFNTVSLSAGGTYAVARQWKLGLNVSRSVRAPAIDELFANGPHAGTQAFERGNPDLKPERSLGAEASLRHSNGPVKFGLTAYRSQFTNFIFQVPTGEITRDLPVFEYRQSRATYVGFELDAQAGLGRALGIDWTADLIGDAVRATVRNFGPAPQIPPLRLLGGLAGKAGKFGGRLEVERSFAQHRNAALETPTAGFTLVNASLDWQPLGDRPELNLSLSANNIFDVVARRHASLLKDYAPLAGRDIRLTARVAL